MWVKPKQLNGPSGNWPTFTTHGGLDALR